MMQYKDPDDWVLSTGETHTVEEFVNIAFSSVDLDWKEYVETDDKFLRPNEVNYLLGDSTKAQSILKWKPKVSFEQLVEMMVEEDCKLAEQEKILIEKNLLDITWN